MKYFSAFSIILTYFIANNTSIAAGFNPLKAYKKHTFKQRLNKNEVEVASVMKSVLKHYLHPKEFTSRFYDYNDGYTTPLIWLIKNIDPKNDEHLSLFKLWLQHINIHNITHGKPLFVAVTQNKDEIINILLDKNAAIPFGAIVCAAKSGRTKLLKSLLNHENSQQQAEFGIMAGEILQETIQKKDLETVKVLMETKIDLEENLSLGHTPLSTAVSTNAVEIVEFFISLNANVNHASQTGQTPLMLSAKHPDDIRIMQILIENRADINRINNYGRSALSEALSAKNKKAVNYLIEHKATLTQIEQKDWFNLILSQKQGHRQSFKTLEEIRLRHLKIEHVPRFFYTYNPTNREDTTPLNWLVKHSDNNFYWDLIPIWIKNGNLNQKDNNGKLPIDIAIQHKKYPALKLLLEKNAIIESSTIDKAIQSEDIKIINLVFNENNINSVDENGVTPLMQAAKNDQTKIAEIFLELKANVNMEDENDQNALMHAASLGHTKFIQILSKKIENIDDTNNNGDTAFLIAAKNGFLPAVKLLLKLGADATKTNDNDFNALMYAAQEGHTSVVELLLSKDLGIDVNDNSNDGTNPAILASKFNHLPILTQLSDKEANLDLTDDNGWTPLMHAAHRGNTPIVEFLLKKGVNINATNENHQTALSISAAAGTLEVVQQLLPIARTTPQEKPTGFSPLSSISGLFYSQKEEDKDIEKDNKIIGLLDHSDIDGKTPLMHASENGHILIVKHLIELKADTSITDKEGQTALVIAINKKHVEIAQYLISKTDLETLRTKDAKCKTALEYAVKNPILKEDLIKAGLSFNIQGECTICLEDLEEGDLQTIKCGHMFHKECINSPFCTTCPICREPM